MKLNKYVWDILLPDEKMALSLQLGMEKSSWESGEILNKSHYKYLEIKYRAEHFMKMFTEYYELFNELFPSYLTGNKIAIGYFRLCIEKRYKPLKAIEILSQEHGKVHKKVLNALIIKTLKNWDSGENAYNKNALELVKEFDRWNNFRILPKEIQEPSAFKRRVKNSYKKQLRVIQSIHPIALAKLRKLYETNKSPYVYVPFLMDNNPEIYKMKVNKGSMEIFNNLGMYTFKDRKLAEEYIEGINEYILKGKKDCIDGLNFWPRFRELIKESYNYMEVMKISSSRKYLKIAMEKYQLL